MIDIPINVYNLVQIDVYYLNLCFAFFCMTNADLLPLLDPSRTFLNHSSRVQLVKGACCVHIAGDMLESGGEISIMVRCLKEKILATPVSNTI